MTIWKYWLRNSTRIIKKVSKNVEAHNWKNTNCKRNNQSFESGEADNFEFVILLLMGSITNNLKIYYIPKGVILWIKLKLESLLQNVVRIKI